MSNARKQLLEIERTLKVCVYVYVCVNEMKE